MLLLNKVAQKGVVSFLRGYFASAIGARSKRKITVLKCFLILQMLNQWIMIIP